MTKGTTTGIEGATCTTCERYQREHRALNNIRVALHLNPQTDPEGVLRDVKWLISDRSEACDLMQTIVQRDKLGLGGENVFALVAREYERLRSIAVPGGGRT